MRLLCLLSGSGCLATHSPDPGLLEPQEWLQALLLVCLVPQQFLQLQLLLQYQAESRQVPVLASSCQLLLYAAIGRFAQRPKAALGR